LARGLTLVELLITISLLGLLMSAIAVAVFHQHVKAQIKTAAIACANLRSVVQASLATEPESAECPTPVSLKASHEIDTAASTDDPWGTEYRIECRPEEIIASSAGPDRAFGTEDDIRVPGPRSRAAPVATRR
jgi:prepilin-type N-terminal cleavage/methylation domain-containing protein